MKKIKLGGKHGKGKFAIVDDVDYERLNKYKWHVVDGYVRTAIYLGGGKKNRKIAHIPMHRMVLGLPDSIEVDHWNRDTFDNCQDNLRPSSRADNNRNQSLRSDNKSGYKGVCWQRGKWVANIQADGTMYRLGKFDNAEEAAYIYDQFALVLFGNFAYLNVLC